MTDDQAHIILARISGLLVDAEDIPVGPDLAEGVRLLREQRDQARKLARHLVSDEGTIGPAGLHAEIRRLTRERDEARSLLAQYELVMTQDDQTVLAEVERLTRERDEACEGESLRAQERDAARRERDRLRLIVMETAAQGCVFDWRPVVCTHSSTSRDHWCLPCRARAALEDK